ncbi:hypothetical protein G7Z17_g8493 [Cylindrodendrum hubeiense]|uniref:Protein kinase domain-containing protein n=1 Tax=Cylindrodendrum hubeiense TaxID=595255 RepID=A0A9P5H148_9HYPO|nr:hypothetical protein G7Z17_g8493 [Cylindrodendrum hubeiense]
MSGVGELIGTTLAVVGVMGQMFDGCIKAYGFFTTAANLEGDSQRLSTKVRIEQMRLVVWGRDWGVAEGKLEAHLDSTQNPQLRKLAMDILQELHGTVTDFRKLQDRYGLLDQGASANLDVKTKAKGGKVSPSASPAPSRKGSCDEKANGLAKSSTASSERSFKKEFSLRARQGQVYNSPHRLERYPATSPVAPILHRSWTHELLESAKRDLAQLSQLTKAATGVYPQLTASATLKSLRINLDTKPQASFKPTFALKVPRPTLHIPEGADQRRCQAHHDTAGDVIIEWVAYDRDDFEERYVHVRRLDDLAHMMHSASECHPDLHSIDCVGYTDDAANNRYGLVYKAPRSSFSTLHTLISSVDLKTPDLNDRVRLAHTLAVALWSLHSLDWLHKSLCSSNILFFPSAVSKSAHEPTASAALVPDIATPFLTGFDASRPDLDTALSVVSRNPSIATLHRHPASLRGMPHCKPFDVYSLGLVLLEIGLWKVLQAYHKPHYSADRWRDKVILSALVPGLNSKVGRRYREVVEMCLRAGEHMTSSEAGKLMETVVTTLEGIRV